MENILLKISFSTFPPFLYIRYIFSCFKIPQATDKCSNYTEYKIITSTIDNEGRLAVRLRIVRAEWAEGERNTRDTHTLHIMANIMFLVRLSQMVQISSYTRVIYVYGYICNYCNICHVIEWSWNNSITTSYSIAGMTILVSNPIIQSLHILLNRLFIHLDWGLHSASRSLLKRLK